MKTIGRITLLSLFMAICFQGFSQPIEYGYDGAGNRVLRKVLTLKTSESDMLQTKDSTFVADNQESEESFNEMLGDQQITIYPNPTKGRLIVDITNFNDAQLTHIELFDISGRSLYRKTYTGTAEDIDLSDEPNGSYIMKISSGTKKSEWKIVKI